MCLARDLLHVVVCEAKRADTYPWRKESTLPSKAAVNKAENQLTKDAEIMTAILAGIPTSQIMISTLGRLVLIAEEGSDARQA